MSRSLWLFVTLFIIYGTTIPFRFSPDGETAREKLAAVSWNPLVRVDGSRVSVPDSVQNIMLFVPFGLCGAFACRRRYGSALAVIAVVSVTAFVLSGMVETLQLFTIDRVASVADIATNTIGAVSGALLAVYGRHQAHALLRRYRAAEWLTTASAYPVIVAVVVLTVAAWQPFDFTLDVGGVASKLRALLQDPWQAGPLTDEANAVVLYALSTLAFIAWLDARGVQRAPGTGAALVVALNIGLELSQVFVSSRMPSGWDATVRAVGVAIGAGLWPVLRRPGNQAVALGLLVMATIACAAMSMLSPFTLVGTRQAFAWFPLLGYYNGNWFSMLSHVIDVMLLYFPLGFCLGLARPHRSTLLLTLVTVLLIASGIEYLQSWIVGRYADLTDVACSVLGGALGTWFSTRGADLFAAAREAASRGTSVYASNRAEVR